VESLNGWASVLQNEAFPPFTTSSESCPPSLRVRRQLRRGCSARTWKRRLSLDSQISAAHHIVAGRAPQAAEARRVLERYGIGINDPSNGVFLPKNLSVPNPNGAYVHSILHRKAYYSAVNELLSQASSRQEVLNVLSYIRDRLLAGELP
jgi:hypothetical protein